MATEDNSGTVIAVGASAGGVEALIHLVAGLPADLPCPVLVTLHMPARAPSVLAQILDRHGSLPAKQAVDGAPLEPGTIRVAVPGRHLLVHEGRIVLSEGPTENGHRPAVNALFRSVALACGQHAVGVLLSGMLDDGALGLAAIRSRGGTTIAQSPTDALFPAMPLNAIEAGVVDHQVAADEAGALLKQLAAREYEEREMEPNPSMELENQIAMAHPFTTSFEAEALGPPSGYTCPDCNGSLIAVDDNNYRCQVGHAWTGHALLRARDHEVENAFWVAMRSLHEKAKLARRLSEQAGSSRRSERHQAVADEAEHAMTVLGERLSETFSYEEAGSDG
jgi:two-component system chemotaxis response regulator CheB